MVITSADGHREERLAYFDQGHWREWLTTQQPGAYHATLTRNAAGLDVPAAGVVVPETARLAEGFVRLEGTRVSTDAGTVKIPLGITATGIVRTSQRSPEQLQRTGAAKTNSARVWACAWDGKNTLFHRGCPPPPLGELLPSALHLWDGIVSAAETAGVRLRFVICNYGLLSSRNDSNWGENTSSRINGGFLDRPQPFFTDEEAKEYSRCWLRDAIRRCGHWPAAMDWSTWDGWTSSSELTPLGMALIWQT